MFSVDLAGAVQQLLYALCQRSLSTDLGTASKNTGEEIPACDEGERGKDRLDLHLMLKIRLCKGQPGNSNE